MNTNYEPLFLYTIHFYCDFKKDIKGSINLGWILPERGGGFRNHPLPSHHLTLLGGRRVFRTAELISANFYYFRLMVPLLTTTQLKGFISNHVGNLLAPLPPSIFLLYPLKKEIIEKLDLEQK